MSITLARQNETLEKLTVPMSIVRAIGRTKSVSPSTKMALEPFSVATIFSVGGEKSKIIQQLNCDISIMVSMFGVVGSFC